MIKRLFEVFVTDSVNRVRNFHIAPCLKIFVVVFFPFVLLFVLFYPYKVSAQVQGFPVTYFGSIDEDEEEGRLIYPSCVVAEPVMNEIYVIDSKARIIIYTSDFFPLYTLGKRNGIEAPICLTVGLDGNLYVAQSSTKENLRNRVSIFNSRLIWERDIFLEGFEGADAFIPYHLSIDKKGNIYLAGLHFPGILVLNNQYKFLEMISPKEKDEKVKLNYVTTDQTGKIYLVSEEEGRVYVYDENRKFLFKLGEKGGSTGKLSRPVAVGVDNRNGRIYVVDYMRHTISAYDKEGKYLFEFGGLGWGEGWFQYPRDIAVDSTGRIFVADTFNDRIEVFQPKENQ